LQIHKLSVLLGLLGASACVEVPQSAQTGPNTVAGHATLATQGYSRACEDVVLLPVTSEIEKRFAPFGEWHSDKFIGEFNLRHAVANDEIQRLRRETECAGDGGFLFRNVPSGQYLLIARVTWSMHWARHGGYLVRKISVVTNTDGIDISVIKDDA
jgi:hypothetical protein